MKLVAPYPRLRTNLAHGGAIILAALAYSLVAGIAAITVLAAWDGVFGTNFMELMTWPFTIKGALLTGDGMVWLRSIPALNAGRAQEPTIPS